MEIWQDSILETYDLNVNISYLFDIVHFHFIIDSITIVIWLFNVLLNKKELEFYVYNLIVGYFKSKGSVFIPGYVFTIIVNQCENKTSFQSKK
jgi:hypothetical protein